MNKIITQFSREIIVVLLGVILFMLCSCGPNYYLKRSQQLERKAIIMGAIVTKDTVYKNVEVITPVHHIDTVLNDVNFSDTIIVYKDRILTKIKVNTKTNTIYEKVKCPSDTVIKRVPVTVEKLIKTESGIRWWWLLIALGIGFVLCFIVKR
jgi:hypothetical protein